MDNLHTVNEVLNKNTFYHQCIRQFDWKEIISLVLLTNIYIIQAILMQQGAKYHRLDLTYQQFQERRKDISNTTIGNYYAFQLIGQGAYGQVYQAMHNINKRSVALKVIDLRLAKAEPNQKKKAILLRLIQSEDKIMTLCNSPNLVRCFDVYENEDLKIIVMQYCNGGNLDDLIEKQKKIPEKQAIKVLRQILNGVAELHSKRIVHRDLKAENILKHNEKFKIGDFGFSKKLNIHNDEVIGFHTLLGTECTMAPEVINNEKYGLKADIWSVGVIFYKMLFGQLPFASARRHQLHNSELLKKKVFRTKRIDISNHTEDFLKAVLVVDQAQRIGWEEVIKHPIFSEVNHELTEIIIGNIQIAVPLSVEFNPEEGPKFSQRGCHLSQQVYPSRPFSVDFTNQLKRNEQDIFYEYLSLKVYQYLKVKVIYFDVILQFEKNEIVDMTDREFIELLYLLLTRCFLDISPIHQAIKLQKPKDHSLYQVISQFEQLYSKVYDHWQRYCTILSKKESSLACIISDFFESSQKRKEKDAKMNGIDNKDYQKQEQVQFIEVNYIRPMIADKKLSPHLRISDLLRKYKDIVLTEPQKLKNRRFDGFIEELLNQ